MSCEFFDGLFYSDIPTRNKDEILLEDVDFDDFTQFVKVMYPPYGPIDGTLLVLKRIFKLPISLMYSAI